jgi:mycothiol system anti-sigma-R factor
VGDQPKKDRGEVLQAQRSCLSGRLKGIFFRLECSSDEVANAHTDDAPIPSPNYKKMSPCDEYAVKTLRYLDNDLKGQELEDFRSHLESCADCRDHLEAEKALSQLLRRSRPLYSTPEALRDRLATLLVQPSERNHKQDRVDHRVHRSSLKRLVNWRVLVPASVVLALCLLLIPHILRNVEAASYVETAVAAHRNCLSGNLPPTLQSNSAEEITAWFAGKLPFDFRVPTAESGPEKKPAYKLTGAAVVNYKGSPAALVMYETQNDKISLLVDSSSSAIVWGGDEIRFGRLTFHSRTDAGFKVITWSTHGLSYALVSSVSGSAGASCLVCHQNMADHGDFKTHP